MLEEKQNRKVAVMQPYLFPYIGYFQLIKSVDTFVVFDNVNYIKKGWINRNRIVFDGREKLFTIPLIKASQNRLIGEIELFNWVQSKAHFLDLIKSAYSRSPQFFQVMPIIELSLNYPGTFVSGLSVFSLQVISNFLGIATEFIPASNFLNLDNEKGEKKILSILTQLNASEYVNAPGGRDLYNQEEFNKLGFALRFLQAPQIIIYQQNSDSFIPNLSIIDLLMNVEKERVIKMVNDYKLEV